MNNANSAAKIRDGIYHRDLGLPASVVPTFVGRFTPDYSVHARCACFTDRYGLIELPRLLEVVASSIVEIEVRAGVAVKAVIRVDYKAGLDLVVVLCRPFSGFAFVKTVWLNRADDGHKTLNRAAYAVAA